MQIMRATLGEVDVEIIDANGTVKDFDTLLQEAADHGADLTQVEKLQAAATIFGKQNMAGMLAIINSSQKDYDKLSSSVRNCTYKYDDITEALMNTKLGFEEMSTSAEKESGWEFGEY